MEVTPSDRARQRVRDLTTIYERARDNYRKDICKSSAKDRGATLTEADQKIFPKFAEIMWGGEHVE